MHSGVGAVLTQNAASESGGACSQLAWVIRDLFESISLD